MGNLKNDRWCCRSGNYFKIVSPVRLFICKLERVCKGILSFGENPGNLIIIQEDRKKEVGKWQGRDVN